MEDGLDDDAFEEDWSDIVRSLPSDGGFARHDDLYEVSLKALAGRGLDDPDDNDDDDDDDVIVVVRIASVEALSPLDMVDLGWGTRDATGHRIWLGAKLFLYAIPKLGRRYLQGRRILELGTGTGLAGIAIDKTCVVKNLVLTDASDSALDLCRRNCINNHVSKNVAVEKLVWGECFYDESGGDGPARDEASDAVEMPPQSLSLSVFDTIVATDVVYDLQSWKPLLETVSRRLHEKGTLILSHVPRAALPLQSALHETSTIEELLIEQARWSGLDLGEIIYPAELLPRVAKDGIGPSVMETSIREMRDAGASILLFHKQTDISVSSRE